MPERLLHTALVQSDERDPEAWLVVVSGIYGAGRNWRPVARRLVEARPGWGVILTDLRGHGRSPHLDPPHTLASATEDVERTMASLGLPIRGILGHSFGGKIALTFATHGQFPVEQVWVIDSTPETGDPRGSAWGMLRVLRVHSGPFRDRDEAIAAIESEGYPNPVAQWMSTNLQAHPDGLSWRLDPDQMEEFLRDFFRSDRWAIVEDPPRGISLHFVRATDSTVLSEGAAHRILEAGVRNGRVHLHGVEGGHWLNQDNPDALHRLLVSHL
jgi:pimeloyl-ACP methyl ester carboxylesterase